MREIKVKVHPSKSNLSKQDQLAWKIAEIATDNAPINKDSEEMVINRIIDNASVAIASFDRTPVISAREMALAHPRENGASVFGMNSKYKVDVEIKFADGSIKKIKTLCRIDTENEVEYYKNG